MRRRRIRSLAVVPLTLAGEAVGVLVLYAGERHFFHDEEELKLVTELAGDVAFAIGHLDEQAAELPGVLQCPRPGLANRSLLSSGSRSTCGGLSVAVASLPSACSISKHFDVDDQPWPAGRRRAPAAGGAVAPARLTGDTNLVARVGADHFPWCCREVRPGGSVAHLLEKVMAAFLEHPFRLNDAVFRIAFKCGVALFPEHGADTDTLLRRRDCAQESQGERRSIPFTPHMTASVASELTLENQLRQALEGGNSFSITSPRSAWRTANSPAPKR